MFFFSKEELFVIIVKITERLDEISKERFFLFFFKLQKISTFWLMKRNETFPLFSGASMYLPSTFKQMFFQMFSNLAFIKNIENKKFLKKKFIKLI